MQSGLGAFLVALVLAPASAGSEAAPVVPDAVLDGDPSGAGTETSEGSLSGTPVETPDPAMLALQPATARLFHALQAGASDEDVEKLVSAAAIELDMNCPRVKEYQVYRATMRARTLKVKCVERPLYAVTIGISGEGFVSGGDGTIEQMRLKDGPIKQMFGLRAEEYLAQEQAAVAANDGVAEYDGNANSRLHVGRRWLVRAAWAAGLAALIGVAVLVLRERRRHKQSYARWRGLDSDAKDQLLEVSEEIYPDVYRHPDGVFIARGRRGKRRLFPSLVFAYLYSSRGFKLFEIK